MPFNKSGSLSDKILICQISLPPRLYNTMPAATASTVSKTPALTASGMRKCFFSHRVVRRIFTARNHPIQKGSTTGSANRKPRYTKAAARIKIPPLTSFSFLISPIIKVTLCCL